MLSCPECLHNLITRFVVAFLFVPSWGSLCYASCQVIDYSFRGGTFKMGRGRRMKESSQMSTQHSIKHTYKCGVKIFILVVMQKKKKNRFRFIPNPVYRILKVFHQFIVRNYEENFVGY